MPLTPRLLADRLPDLPRWVEARALLLESDCEIIGLQTSPTLAFILQETDAHIWFVIGQPDLTIIQAAVQPALRRGEVLTPLEHASWLAPALPGWRSREILVHTLPDTRRLPALTGAPVGFLDPALIPALSIDPELKTELLEGASASPVAAVFDNQLPVSFCYAGAVTESLWDIAVDTVPEHRRQGYAGLSATFMIEHQRRHGKQPVWQALVDNPDSWRLAARLGFEVIDHLALFEPA